MRKVILVRLAAVICVFIMLTSLNCSISNADVVWEPEDSFYKQHANECTYVDEELTAYGPNGKVTIWKSPVSDIEIGSIENGSKVFIDYTYTDKRGYRWGIVYRNGETGWVPMNYLIKDPGYLNFITKHRDEYHKYSGTFVPEGATKLIFWTYPGSGEIRSKISIQGDESIAVDSTYTDSDGRQWGIVGYFRAQDGWICMSDPSNEQIPVNEEDAADIVTPPVPDIVITPKAEGSGTIILISALVAVVAAVTILLVRTSFKNNGRSNERK